MGNDDDEDEDERDDDRGHNNVMSKGFDKERLQ